MKIEFLVWTGKQYVLMNHDWILDEVLVNRAGVTIKLQPKTKEIKPEEKKP